jgi:predicted ATPase/class 3 adenylate cyclase/DNA-binding CsgD family transcriptional regulator
MQHAPVGAVTFLLTDLEGSTRLLQQVGEEHYQQVIADYRHLLRTACTSWYGEEVDTQGDAFVVMFVSATDAVAAASAIQQAMANHSWPQGVTIRARVGLHTGEPHRVRDGSLGVDVQQAVRIMCAAHGGQVLLSHTTAALVEAHLPEQLQLRDLGFHRLRDLHWHTHLFQLIIDGLPAEFPAPKTLESHPNNLPSQPTAFLGREHDFTRLRTLLLREEVRLVTLTGPAGVGKTRLALQLGAELIECFSDGVFFVPLAAVTAPEQVVPAILQALALREQGTSSPLDRLAAALVDKQMLVLLDNFEQVAQAALQVASLLSTCPRLKVLVTSRERLHLQAEHEYSVPPLATPGSTSFPDASSLTQYEAAALFVARAQGVRPDFQLTDDNAEAVAAICLRLDGLPLAIELAAARLRYFSPSQILAQLDHALAVLSAGARDLPVRQQTLRGAIAWSYLLLPEQEQQLFRRLAVFVGSCDIQAATVICTAASPLEGEILEGMLSLVDKSLLWPREDDGGLPRFSMLQLLREFGLEQLEGAGETEATREAHAAYYLQLAEQPLSTGNPARQQKQWHERLGQEHDNLHAALSFLLKRAQGEKEERRQSAALRSLRLCLALSEYWRRRGTVREAVTFFERSLQNRAGIEEALLAEALYRLGRLLMTLDAYEQVEARLSESLALFQSLGDKRGSAAALVALAEVERSKGASDLAWAHLREADALCQETGESIQRARCLASLARMCMAQGDYRQAQILLEESVRLTQAAGESFAPEPLSALALLLFVSNQDLARAAALAEACLIAWRELGEQQESAGTLNLLGDIRLAQGAVDEAQRLLEQSLALFQRVGDRANEARVLIALARVAVRQQDGAAASRLCEASLNLLHTIGFRFHIPAALEEWAAAVALQGKLIRAAQLWGAAEALRETLGMPLMPAGRAAYEQAIARVRTQLEERTFVDAWARGRRMKLEEILAPERSTPNVTPSQEARVLPSSRKHPSYPDGLTTREVEVLRLVAAGLTDAQIAQQLVISPRTVNAHLTSIYSKISVSSRTAATRYALEHHLT